MQIISSCILSHSLISKIQSVAMCSEEMYIRQQDCKMVDLLVFRDIDSNLIGGQYFSVLFLFL